MAKKSKAKKGMIAFLNFLIIVFIFFLFNRTFGNLFVNN